mgnify:CR=1 FL=1
MAAPRLVSVYIMWILKGCTRCDSGDMMQTEDQFGGFFQCLQCGHLSPITWRRTVGIDPYRGSRYWANMVRLVGR